VVIDRTHAPICQMGYGNDKQYLRSKLKIVTIGYNGSSVDKFLGNDPLVQRYLQHIASKCEVSSEILDYFEETRTHYFDIYHNHDQHKYFAKLELLLSCIDSSYYHTKKNRAIHIDICPFATTLSWGDLPAVAKYGLRLSFEKLFLQRLRKLSPHIIFFNLSPEIILALPEELKVTWTNMITLCKTKSIYYVKQSTIKLDGVLHETLGYALEPLQIALGGLSKKEVIQVGCHIAKLLPKPKV